MRQIQRAALFLFVLAGVLATACGAARAQQGPFGARPGMGGHAPPGEQREEMEKKIYMMLMIRISDELDLDEEASLKLHSILKKQQEEKNQTAREMEGLLDSLRREASAEKPDRNALVKTIDQVKAKHTQMAGMQARALDEIGKILSVEKQARFILTWEDIQRDIREMIMQVKERRGEPGAVKGKFKPKKENLP